MKQVFKPTQPTSQQVNFKMADGEFHSKITINVRSTTGEKSVEIKEDATVEELKNEIATQFCTTVEQVHLIFAGKFLNDHEEIKKRNIKDRLTIFLVIKNKNMRLQEASNQASLPRRNLSELDIVSDLEDLSELPYIVNDPTLLSDMRERIQRDLTNNSVRIREFLTNLAYDSEDFDEDSDLPEYPAIENILREMDENPQFLSNVDAPFLQIMMHILKEINPNPEISERLDDAIAYFDRNPDHQHQMQNIVQKITSHLQGTDTEEFYRSPAYKEAMLRILLRIAKMPSVPSTTDTSSTTTNASTDPTASQPATTSSGYAISSATERFCELITTIAFSVEQLGDKYAFEMNELANMGFGDTEANLEALVNTSGNITEAIESLLQSSRYNSE